MILTFNPLQLTLSGTAFMYVVLAWYALCCQLFEATHHCNDEFETEADRPDSPALANDQVQRGVPYSEAMIVSDDSDATCNLFHTRKASGPFHDVDCSACFILSEHSFTEQPATLALSVPIEAFSGGWWFSRTSCN